MTKKNKQLLNLRKILQTATQVAALKLLRKEIDESKTPKYKTPTALRILRIGAKLTKRGVKVVGKTGVRVAGRGVRATGAAAAYVGRSSINTAKAFGRAVDRIRREGYGPTKETYNKKLKGFALSAADYDKERLADRERAMKRKVIQDSQTGLGIRSHHYYSKTELAGGGAVAARANATYALNRQIAKRNEQVLKNLRTRAAKAVASSIYFDVKELTKNLERIRTTTTKTAIDKLVKTGEEALRKFTPAKSGTMLRSIKSKSTDSHGAVWYDTMIAYYAPFVDKGTKHMKGRYMTKRAMQVVMKKGVADAIRAYKKAVKI